MISIDAEAVQFGVTPESCSNLWHKCRVNCTTNTNCKLLLGTLERFNMAADMATSVQRRQLSYVDIG
jgi:hypothetical protein